MQQWHWDRGLVHVHRQPCVWRRRNRGGVFIGGDGWGGAFTMTAAEPSWCGEARSGGIGRAAERERLSILDRGATDGRAIVNRGALWLESSTLQNNSASGGAGGRGYDGGRGWT